MNPICPLCGHALVANSFSYTCAQGHAFDVAKEGYVNLLVRRGKAPAFEGDSLEMLKARREFLQKGYYGQLLSRVVEFVAGSINGCPGVLLDVGCGEGYYLGGLMGDPRMAGSQFYGIDIAKAAVQLAAKKYKEALFAVADVKRQLPFPDDSIDLITNIFAPRNEAEFLRVLKPGGSLLVVIPGDGHLLALREKLGLMGIQENKVDKVKETLGGFYCESVETVRYGLALDVESVVSLVGMTPSARFMSDEEVREKCGSGKIWVGVEFQVMEFKK